MARAAAARCHHLFEGGVTGTGVGDATGEGVANRPEAVAAGAKAQGVDRLEFEAPEDRHLRVVSTVGAARLGRRWRPFGGLAAQVGEDLVGTAFPCAGCGAGTGSGQPAVVGSTHS